MIFHLVHSDKLGVPSDHVMHRDHRMRLTGCLLLIRALRGAAAAWECHAVVMEPVNVPFATPVLCFFALTLICTVSVHAALPKHSSCLHCHHGCTENSEIRACLFE